MPTLHTNTISIITKRLGQKAIGQSLYYIHKTGKKPMVILILENPQKQIL